jgi:hypothetical protein
VGSCQVPLEADPSERSSRDGLIDQMAFDSFPKSETTLHDLAGRPPGGRGIAVDAPHFVSADREYLGNSGAHHPHANDPNWPGSNHSGLIVSNLLDAAAGHAGFELAELPC